MLSRARWIRPALLALGSAACEVPALPFGSGPVPEPVLFATGSVSTTIDDEYAISFSSDGKQAYFTRGAGGRGAPPPRIFTTRFVDGAWTPAVVAPFSTAWDEAPFLTPDGDRLIFSSRRDVPGWGAVRENGNLWVATRTEQGWSEALPLSGEVNRPRVGGRGAPARTESGPFLLADGSLLYWTTEDSEWGPDLYVADPVGDRFVDPRPLRLNSSGSERSPTVSPDGRYLVFQAFRDFDAVGEDDLYLSERTAYGWTAPRLLPEPINSEEADGYPSFSPDGRYFFFASDRAPDGRLSIYYVDVTAIGIDPPPHSGAPD